MKTTKKEQPCDKPLDRRQELFLARMIYFESSAGIEYGAQRPRRAPVPSRTVDMVF
jgi:hypothetical protein